MAKIKLSGVAVPHHKNTNDCVTELLPVPDKVYIAMSQHIGAPCEPIVAVGDEVKVGQLIADSSSYISAPIHSSVSGKVTAITDLIMPSGARTKTIEIETDKLQTVSEDVKPPVVESYEDFIAAVKASGLVGLGGAGFPTHVKYSPANLKDIDTLMINAAECEPYITADYRTMMEDTEDIADGIHAVMKWMGIKNCVIGVEDNKAPAIQKLNDRFKSEPNIRVQSLKSKYPQGGEKIMMYETTGRIAQEGKLIAESGVIASNVASVAFVGSYLRTGMPLITKRLTVDGSAIARNGNVRAPIGTPIKDIAEFFGGYKKPVKKIMMGGPMMGITVYNENYPLMKNNNALLFFDEAESKEFTESPCIRCGRCVRACPANLMPIQLDNAYEHRDVDALKKFKVNLCIECGCCAYVCPAKRQLVLANRLGKALVRAADAKK